MNQLRPHRSPSADARKIRLLMELRRHGISDTQTLSAMERVPREAFVPAPFLDQAYANKALPIGHGQTLSQPLVVALMTQALSCDANCRVLEIGTGSGYQAAVLANLAREVFTVERYGELLQDAVSRLRQLGLSNVQTRLGDGFAGLPEAAPFDRILVTAAAERVPEALIQQLAPDGVLVLPLGPQAGEQTLLRLRRTAQGMTQENLGTVRFVPLLPGLPSAR